MAAITPTSNHPTVLPSIAINGKLWETLTTTNDVGTPVQISRRTDRTVQVVGTFDGCTVAIEGSLDGTNYSTLNDLQGSALTFTSARLEGVSEYVTWIRPHITVAGSGGADIDVYLIEVAGGE